MGVVREGEQAVYVRWILDWSHMRELHRTPYAEDLAST